jgi:hypothetical protein
MQLDEHVKASGEELAASIARYSALTGGVTANAARGPDVGRPPGEEVTGPDVPVGTTTEPVSATGPKDSADGEKRPKDAPESAPGSLPAGPEEESFSPPTAATEDSPAKTQATVGDGGHAEVSPDDKPADQDPDAEIVCSFLWHCRESLCESVFDVIDRLASVATDERCGAAVRRWAASRPRKGPTYVKSLEEGSPGSLVLVDAAISVVCPRWIRVEGRGKDKTITYDPAPNSRRAQQLEKMKTAAAAAAKAGRERLHSGPCTHAELLDVVRAAAGGVWGELTSDLIAADVAEQILGDTALRDGETNNEPEPAALAKELVRQLGKDKARKVCLHLCSLVQIEAKQ